MKFAIIDDEKKATDLIETYITEFVTENHFEIQTRVFHNPVEFLESYTKDYDLVFLDVEMPGVSGIYVGNRLKQENPNIIIFIVTSYSEYLDEAMRFHVFRYLTKPLDKHRIFRNMKDALEIYNTTIIKVPIETRDGVYVTSASDIIFVESHGHTVTVHTLQKDYNSVHNIKYWIEQLNMPCFFNSHRSFVVNLKYVSDFDHTLIHLHNNAFEAYLTRRKYTQFKDAYLLYLESTR